MLGLVLKDLYNLKTQYKLILGLFAFYLVMAVTGGDSTMFSGVATLMAVMLPISTIAYDERCKWDKYALTMPVSRRQIVLSKYLLGGILAVGAQVMNLIALRAAGVDLAENARYYLLIFAVGIVYLCLVLPLLFKFGVEKGRLLMMAVLLAPTGAVMYLSRAGIGLPGPEVMQYLPYAAPVAAAAVIGISLMISMMIYSRKEL